VKIVWTFGESADLCRSSLEGRGERASRRKIASKEATCSRSKPLFRGEGHTALPAARNQAPHGSSKKTPSHSFWLQEGVRQLWTSTLGALRWRRSPGDTPLGD